MLKKTFFFLMIAVCSTVVLGSDYKAEREVADKLFKARKYDEAMKAFSELAEKTTVPEEKYDCYRFAAFSARNLKKYDEAIALAEKIADIPGRKYYALSRKLSFMNDAKRYKQIADTFSADDIGKWPESYRCESLYYLGSAEYKRKNGKAAYKTFKLLQDNADSDYWRGLANLKLGQTSHTLLNKPEDAEIFFKEVIKLPKAQSGDITVALYGLAYALQAQKKYDDALASYDKLFKRKDISTFIKSLALYRKGEVLKTIGKRDEAIKCYKEAGAVKGGSSWAKENSQKQLELLSPNK